jgi:GNAT superfamily N-acetyltransferase
VNANAGSVVRQAGPTDWEAVLVVHERAVVAGWSDLYEPHGVPVPLELIRQRWRASFESSSNRFAVYEQSGQILGVCLVAPPWLHALSVSPEYWGTDVAAALHDDAIAAIKAAGESDALLRVMAENKRARRFWEKMGWALLPGSGVPHKDPPHFQTLTYHRHLD